MESIVEEYGEEKDLEIGTVGIVVEISFTDEDGDKCDVLRYRCSDGRRWIQAGLFKAAAFSADHQP